MAGKPRNSRTQQHHRSRSPYPRPGTWRAQRGRGHARSSGVPERGQCRPGGHVWRLLRSGSVPGNQRMAEGAGVSGGGTGVGGGGTGVGGGGTGVGGGVGLSRTGAGVTDDILDQARGQVLETGRGLDEQQVLRCLELPDERLSELLSLAHEVRMRWCGPEVEVEGIVSVKTGGCPEDCHFCSQSGQFESPVRSVWLDIDELVAAARETAATGATEFCIVAAVRGPDERLMAQIAAAVTAIRDEVDVNVACSLGILTEAQAAELAALGVHRYNHNLETARSYFGHVVTTHGWEERFDTCQLVRSAGLELCCGGIIGMGETARQRGEL